MQVHIRTGVDFYFLVIIKVEQLNVNLFVDTCRANMMKFGLNGMRIHDSEISIKLPINFSRQ